MNLITLTTLQSARGNQERVLNMDRLIAMTRVEGRGYPIEPPYTTILLSADGGNAREFNVQETPAEIKALAEANA